MTEQSPAKRNLRVEQKNETQRRIRDSARTIFATTPFEQVFMEDIAKAANVGRTTIYFHYATKNALLIGLLQEDWDGQNRIFARLANLEGELTQESLRQWIVSTASGASRSQKFMRLYGYALSLSEEVQAQLEKQRQRLIATLGGRFAAFVPGPGETAAERRAAAASRLMIVQIEYYSLLWATCDSASAEAATDVLFDNLMQFLGPDAPAR